MLFSRGVFGSVIGPCDRDVSLWRSDRRLKETPAAHRLGSRFEENEDNSRISKAAG